MGNKGRREDFIAMSREAKKSPEISLRAFVLFLMGHPNMREQARGRPDDDIF
jgi:hypothetical protein